MSPPCAVAMSVSSRRPVLNPPRTADLPRQRLRARYSEGESPALRHVERSGLPAARPRPVKTQRVVRGCRIRQRQITPDGHLKRMMPSITIRGSIVCIARAGTATVNSIDWRKHAAVRGRCVHSPVRAAPRARQRCDGMRARAVRRAHQPVPHAHWSLTGQWRPRRSHPEQRLQLPAARARVCAATGLIRPKSPLPVHGLACSSGCQRLQRSAANLQCT